MYVGHIKLCCYIRAPHARCVSACHPQHGVLIIRRSGRHEGGIQRVVY